MIISVIYFPFEVERKKSFYFHDLPLNTMFEYLVIY